jgi:hypothetical protein
VDRQHYHYIIEGDGTVVNGDFPPEANEKPVKGRYAAHTLNCNTGSIGVSVAAMRGAQERPFSPGPSPIRPEQLQAMAQLVADLCGRYSIPVTREAVLTHAEVQPTLGIKQKGKWDIAWLPGMREAGNPVEVGDRLRALITSRMAPRPAPKPTPVTLNPTSRPEAVSGVSRKAVGAGIGIIAAAGIALAAKWDQFTAWLAALF